MIKQKSGNYQWTPEKEIPGDGTIWGKPVYGVYID